MRSWEFKGLQNIERWILYSLNFIKKKKGKKFLYSIRYVVYIVDTHTFLGLDEILMARVAKQDEYSYAKNLNF